MEFSVKIWDEGATVKLKVTMEASSIEDIEAYLASKYPEGSVTQYEIE